MRRRDKIIALVSNRVVCDSEQDPSDGPDPSCKKTDEEPISWHDDPQPGPSGCQEKVSIPDSDCKKTDEEPTSRNDDPQSVPSGCQKKVYILDSDSEDFIEDSDLDKDYVMDSIPSSDSDHPQEKKMKKERKRNAMARNIQESSHFIKTVIETCITDAFDLIKDKFTKKEPQLYNLFILAAFIHLAAPGVQFSRRNDTDPGLTRPCTLMEFVDGAQCFQTQYRLMCRRGITGEWIKGIQEHITHLMVLEWPGSCFNLGRLQDHFPELRHLEFINCTALNTFKGHFGPLSKIEKLAMHGLTSLWELPGDVIAQMPELREIDLRNNVLRHMKAKLLRAPPKLERVYLGDNKWDCSDGGLDWLAMEKDNGTVKRSIMDYFKLMCHQQLYRGKPLHKVLDIIRSVRQTCPAPCACAMTHVVSDRAGNIIPLITVDCADQALTAPPATLPPSTTTLRLEGNKINTIRAMMQNQQYKTLADLYLDNNSIPNVKELEGSEWFSTFRVLSLRGNLLRSVPIYVFDKAFQSNNNIMHVFLGHNPWRCDCHYTPRFQALLLKYKRIIRDLPDIRCSQSDDKETSLVQISTMSLGSVCSSSSVRMPISTINMVNLVLAALILLVVGRFLYDWHKFKTTGKLPWISSILP